MKIKEDELKTIQEQQGLLNSIMLKIGGLETAKHAALHEIAAVNADVEATKKELEAKYGSIDINVETGEYTEVDREQKLEPVK